MAQLRAYCTYFDSGYLSRGLSLIASLREHGDDSPIWVLTLDDKAKQYLDEAALPNVFTLTMNDIEAAEPDLAPLKPERSRMEYIFTSTPLVMRWVMNKQADESTVVIYLDSDLFFFDRPGLVLDALGTGSVGIIEHKYQRRLATRLAKYGRFNVGWVGIRADARGRACLDWWAESTLAWCFDKPEDGKYADQGYLDRFPDLFEGVVVLPSKGFNLAPWNTGGHHITQVNGTVMVDGDRLDFFHFHGVRRVGDWYVSSQLVYGSRVTRVLRDDVYAPYLRTLEANDRVVLAALGAPATHPRGNGIRGIVSRLRKSTIDRITIVTGNALSLKRLSARGRRAPRSPRP
jgi:hypothetical protein